MLVFEEIGARLIVGDAVGHRVDVYPNIIKRAREV
jgi:hypothetical protein